MLIMLHIHGWAQAGTALMNRQQKQQLIDQLGKLLEVNYVFADTAQKMSQYLHAQFKNGAYDSLDKPNFLAAKLSADILSIYHDGHLKIRYSPGLATSLGNTNEVNKEDKLKNEEFHKRINFGFNKVEVLEGAIGYIQFNQFSDLNKESEATVRATLEFIRNCRAIIFDLRSNGGGEPEMIRYICNFLFPERTHLNDLYSRRDQKTYEFWTSPDKELTSLMHIPIYILTSKFTFSGAEEFAYDLQTRKRATIVGENTGGGAHPVEPRAAGYGFVLFVPFARAINPVTKTNWEGSGVHPDIEIQSDQALGVALNDIKNKLSKQQFQP
jgi:C-terminal processing protease CtpA/Prc